MSVNSEITAETSRAINSEISTQMSRKVEEMKSDLNSRTLNVVNSATGAKVIPSIKNAIGSQNSSKNANLELGSDGPHPSTFSSVRPQWDLRSYAPQQEKACKTAQNAKKDFPRLVAMSNNQRNRHRENSVDSRQSDDADGYES